MTLAFALYKYFPYGGLQRDFLRIATQCQQRGYTIRVYVREWQGAVPPGFDVRCAPRGSLTSHGKNRRFQHWLAAQIAACPVDLLIGFNKMPALDIYYAADGCYEQRVAQQYRGFSAWFYRQSARYRHFSNDERAVFSPASNTEILMISDLQKSVFQGFYHTPEQRMHSLPPGISADRRAPENAEHVRRQFRQQFAIEDSERLMLAVGSGFKTKGLDRSLHALANLPQDLRERTRFFVIGQDKSRQFEALARQLGIGEKLTIFKGRDDVPCFMQGADVLVHPAYYENTGTVLLEALVAGLPVLTTDVCGYARYITEAGAGRVLPSPFQQEIMTRELADMLTSAATQPWRVNGLAYAETADIYSLPSRAADFIERQLRGRSDE